MEALRPEGLSCALVGKVWVWLEPGDEGREPGVERLSGGHSEMEAPSPPSFFPLFSFFWGFLVPPCLSPLALPPSRPVSLCLTLPLSLSTPPSVSLISPCRWAQSRPQDVPETQK